ncbi:hypothetical protein ACEQ8H_004578 [Pleosporales sp. CAS-2024a]
MTEGMFLLNIIAHNEHTDDKCIEGPRRQSRGKSRKSYCVDDEYSFLDDDADSAASHDHGSEVEEPHEDEDDFMPDTEEEPEEELDDEEVVATSSDAGDDSEQDRPATPELEIVEVNSHVAPKIGDGEHKNGKTPRTKLASNKANVPVHTTRGGAAAAKPPSGGPLRTRGVAEFTKAGGQEVRLKDLFGPKDHDLAPILKTRDFWGRPPNQQEALPVKDYQPGKSSLRRSFFESKDARQKEILTTRRWYSDSGREAFEKAQVCTSLSAEEAVPYLANDGDESLNVLCGPIDDAQVYTLKKLSYMNVAEPFKQKEGRRGWLFNLGAKVQDAQWATLEDSSTQYLAVAVEQKSRAKNQPKLMENPKAPAFTATNPFPASIQIWAFDANERGELDVEKQPRLQLVICTDWGAPKQLRWCPIDTSVGVSKDDERDITRIGLVAGIWSDGRARILDVSCPTSTLGSSETQYSHMTHAAFDITFPHTVPTCLRWLSGTTMAIATALGTLAIWTLSHPSTLSTSPTSQTSPRPWFYHQLSDTYILTLTSGYPSQPHLISITTADGFGRLYDMRTPSADNTASIRGRTLCVTQDWHEQTQSFIGPDEYYMLKHNPIRRYYHNLYTMRAESIITRCAASPVHPGILIGGADGCIEASNPVGRICNYKLIPWQQTWFKHEWRRPVHQLVRRQPGEEEEEEDDDDENTRQQFSADAPPTTFLEQPLVRITEGYKAVQPGIQHSVTSKKKTTNVDVGKGITIYEEKSAVTALAWNPCLRFGDWAVAGMGSGLLRVEDVGV